MSIGPSAFKPTNFPYLGVNSTNDSPASFTTSNTQRSEIWINDTTSTMWGLAVSGSVPTGYPAKGSFYLDQNKIGPRFVIDPAGNVGIGTIAPTATLEIENGSNSATIVANGKQLYAFGGIFQTWLCDASNNFVGSAISSANCRIPNAITGTCSCPSGYTPAPFSDYNVPLNVCPQTLYDGRGMIEWWCQ